MYGDVLLLVAHQSDPFNTVRPEERPMAFSWRCWRIDQYNLLPDLCQILVYPISQEAAADNMFLLYNECMTKRYHDDVVIYSHISLDERGVYHSGVTSEHILMLPIFCAGLILDRDRLNIKRHTDGVISNPKFKWNMITPNDLFENCFDGYSLVRIYGLHQINVKLDGFCWLDLGPKELNYLSLAGQRYFPFFIQPSRYDRITFTVKWETSDMMDVTDEVDTNSADAQQMLKYFFNNQNTCSLLAAYDYLLYDTEGNIRGSIGIPMTSVIYDQVEARIKNLKQAVVTIQRWWISIYYNPYHPVGNRIVTLHAV